MGSPEPQHQDHYAYGFDVIRMISNEFGSSADLVRRQLTHSSTKIEIDDEPYDGDRLFIPVEKAEGKFVSVIGPERQWRMRFPKLPE